jgi:hypothetical protein
MIRLIGWTLFCASGGAGVIVLNSEWFSPLVRSVAGWYSIAVIAIATFYLIWKVSLLLDPTHNSGSSRFFDLW